MRTPEDFGHSGEAPSDQQLLDWLTREFIDGGWSVKELHRLILTSRTYRQRSVLDARAVKVDPDNRLLWRQRLRRLEAEPFRDAVLSVSGSLDPTMFGPPIGVARRPTGEFAPAAETTARRSIYLRNRRSEPVSVLQAFDQPVMEINCVRRRESTVSTQALTLLNSDFMTRAASDFADRVLKEAPNEPIQRAVQLAFGREQSSTEQTTFQEFVSAQTTLHGGGDEARRLAVADLCHLLLSSNEFAYVD